VIEWVMAKNKETVFVCANCGKVINPVNLNVLLGDKRKGGEL
jgi:hypothetical protein